MNASPFEIELFDKGFVRRGWLNDAAASFTVRHNAVDVATVTVPASHVRAPHLQLGARVVVYFTPPGGVRQLLLSGAVTAVESSGPWTAAELAVTVSSDWRVLDVLAWPVPGAALTAQTVEHWTATGAAETVIKTLITLNVAGRLVRPVTVAPTEGRGGTVKSSLRMTSVADEVTRIGNVTGIGTTVKQSGAGFLVDCYLGVDRRSRPLSEASGTVLDWTYRQSTPTATRVIVGGGGEGTARVFRQVVDAARETAVGGVVEVFQDARDLTITTDMDARGAETLTEAAGGVDFEATLSGTGMAGFGRSLFLGDLVRVEIPSVASVDATVTEATLAWTAEQGLTVTTTVGTPDKTDPLRKTYTTIRDLRNQVRRLEAST